MSEARIERLARRVRWLESKRKPIRIAVAIVVGVVGVIFVPEVLGENWPRFHARLTAIAGAIALAFVVDVAVCGVLALWELEHDRLVRERGLPRAVLRK